MAQLKISIGGTKRTLEKKNHGNFGKMSYFSQNVLIFPPQNGQIFVHFEEKKYSFFSQCVHRYFTIV